MSADHTPPLNGEPALPLAQLAAKSNYPGQRGASRVHPATLTRWILRGARAVDGRTVKLEAVRLGSRWLSSEAALGRFVAALGTPAGQKPARSPAARTKAADKAGAELERLGA